MAVSRVRFAEANVIGCGIEPQPCRAHHGVVAEGDISVNGGHGAVISVNAGQVIFVTAGTPEYCRGFADGKNHGTGTGTPILQVNDHQLFSPLVAAEMYAEWIDGQRRVDGKLFDKECWGL